MVVMFVAVALVRVMDVPRFIPMMLMSVTLMFVVFMLIRMVFVAVALVRVMDVPRFIPMMLMSVTLMGFVFFHWKDPFGRFRSLAGNPSHSPD